MALARARVAARRTKDRWKSKQWYRILAPAAFNNQLLAETLADEPQKLEKRTLEATLHELTGDMKLMHVKVAFQVTDVVDNQAKTAFIGHSMTSDYVRRLTRRGNNKIPLVVDVQTQDGTRLRVKPFAVTDRRVQTSQGQEIRRIMARLTQESAKQKTLGAFLSDMLMGELQNRMYKEARKVHPVRRIELAKSEVITASELVDETPVFQRRDASEASEAPAAEAAETPEAPISADAGEEGGAKKVEDVSGEEE